MYIQNYIYKIKNVLYTMKLLFIGIQGSWKWTQARKLQEEYWFEIFETWQALRNITKQDTELWKLVKKTIEAWEQVTPVIIENILKDYLSKTDNENIIFDGLVRNKWNKKTADASIKDYKVIFFDLPQKEAMKRLLGRMYNPKTWETFPAWILKDPKTGDVLVKRSDDEEQAIKKRIEQFFGKTMPVVETYKKDWNLIKINANQSVDKVFNVIKDKLHLENKN